jgi:hypothetical protein
MLRKIPKSERTIEASDFREDGDTVAFHSYVRFRDPETGEFSELDSDVVWSFNGQGKVVESRSTASIAAVMPPGSQHDCRGILSEAAGPLCATQPPCRIDRL